MRMPFNKNAIARCLRSPRCIVPPRAGRLTRVPLLAMASPSPRLTLRLPFFSLASASVPLCAKLPPVLNPDIVARPTPRWIDISATGFSP